jgi:hypothetical protein
MRVVVARMRCICRPWTACSAQSAKANGLKKRAANLAARL